MELQDAIDKMLKTRDELRSRQGIENPGFISERIQRLAQYTAAAEVHLAQHEQNIQEKKVERFYHYTKTEGKSISQAETLARMDTRKEEGQIANLSRLVKSSWELVKIGQSRYNHLSNEFKVGKHA